MNETINTLYLRRSIRDYEERLVEEYILDEIMKAGTYAASARNSQSSIIIHVKDEQIRLKIKEPANPPIAPSTVFLGLIEGISLLRPNFKPTAYARVSESHAVTKINHMIYSPYSNLRTRITWAKNTLT